MKKVLFLLTLLPMLSLMADGDIAYGGGERIQGRSGGAERSYGGYGGAGPDNRYNYQGGYDNRGYNRGYVQGAENEYNRSGSVNFYGGYAAPEYGGNVVVPEVNPYQNPYYYNQYPQ